jgi:tyrosine-specific transport protein
MIVRSCFWGSLIPAVVYLAWALCVVAIIFNTQPKLFPKMAMDGIDVSELIPALGAASGEGFMRFAVPAISFGAITTSIWGGHRVSGRYRKDVLSIKSQY